jgi:DNA-binding NtrC family response regulator
MTKRKALVIAEAGTIGKMLSMILKSVGCEVEVMEAFMAEDIIGVLKVLSVTKYDLVVPTNNGMSPTRIPEFIEEIRKIAPTVKIIVMSGHHPPGFVRQLWEKGIDDFLPLPFDVQELMARVRKYFAEYTIET